MWAIPEPPLAIEPPLAAEPRDIEAAEESPLAELSRRHLAFSAMHDEAARHYSKKHRNLTLFVMVVALCTTLATNATLGVAPDLATAVSNLAVALNAGVTAINNFLGYQARGEKHRRASQDFREAADRLALLAAGDPNEIPAALEQSRTLHADLRRHSVDLPRWVAAMYPQFTKPPRAG